MKKIFVGIILSLVVVVLGYLLAVWIVSHNPQLKQEERLIEAVYNQFESSIRNGDFVSAYTLMSPAYRKDNNFEHFTYRFRFVERREEQTKPRRFVMFEGEKAMLFPQGASQSHGAIFEFEKIDGTWYLTGKIGVIHN